MTQPELARSARRHPARRVASAPERDTAARVTVAWTSSTDDGGSRPARTTEVELVAGLEAAANRTWTCPASFGSNWLEAISTARCSEVVLSARVGSDTSAKHLVLELAELLTFTLTESQPLIRVLFLPTEPTPRSARTHA